MKNWFASKVVLAAILSLTPGPAWAQSPEDGLACLRATDLRCAQRVRDELLSTTPNDGKTLQLHARTLFHEGRYDEAVEVIQQIEEMGLEPDGYAPYVATAEAASGLLYAEETGLSVRHDRGVERILSQEAVETLRASRATYDTLFGGGPDHSVVLDIYPTASRFTGASGLPPEAVRTTGVVALSKWNRLLLTSPRALARGYNWKDTIAHEYIHLVVAWRTRDLAPVWLQEGLAKHLEGEWRQGRAEYLSVHQQSLLADAIQKDSFVPFEKFRRSMAYLDSGSEAALAFAQVATMVHFLLERAGDPALVKLLDRVRDGESSEDAVADLAGYEDFTAFKDGWKAFIRDLPLVREQLATLPVVLDGEGSEFDSDPILGQRMELVKYARLGDLLREANRPAAALIEYDKATDPSTPPSPMLIARKATCLEMMGKTAQALTLVEEGVSLYPEFPLLQVTAGKLYEEMSRPEDAVRAWKVAHDLNPFNPEVQQALTRGYAALGEPDLAERHERYAQILATGGAVD
ncbi:MAG: hypothetical protein AAFV53_01930 [Myxococcota bacterium]